jgi:hypothetical protein
MLRKPRNPRRFQPDSLNRVRYRSSPIGKNFSVPRALRGIEYPPGLRDSCGLREPTPLFLQPIAGLIRGFARRIG